LTRLTVEQFAQGGGRTRESSLPHKALCQDEATLFSMAAAERQKSYKKVDQIVRVSSSSQRWREEEGDGLFSSSRWSRGTIKIREIEADKIRGSCHPGSTAKVKTKGMIFALLFLGERGGEDEKARRNVGLERFKRG